MADENKAQNNKSEPGEKQNQQGTTNSGEKRKRNPYMLFLKQYRRKHFRDDWSSIELVRKGAEAWRALSPEKKRWYINAAQDPNASALLISQKAPSDDEDCCPKPKKRVRRCPPKKCPKPRKRKPCCPPRRRKPKPCKPKRRQCKPKPKRRGCKPKPKRKPCCG